NYDPVIESLMPWYKPIMPSDSLDTLFRRDFSLIKLHGCARQPETCILSSTGYQKAYNREFEWYLINLFSVNTVIFIGASMDKNEPFFKYLSLLKKNRIDLPSHYALVAIQSSSHGSKLGKWLFECKRQSNHALA
ncbi:MAG: SIR2 family protein, partial [Gammaproteobacteria bacterium]|nr:SIR2 family protein [Gammaproteobacteria bacterium]